MQRALVPIKLSIAHRKGHVHDGAAGAQRCQRRDTCERDQTLQGSACSDDVAGFHDGTSQRKLVLVGAMEWTVNSLYSIVNPLRNECRSRCNSHTARVEGRRDHMVAIVEKYVPVARALTGAAGCVQASWAPTNFFDFAGDVLEAFAISCR
jgi:hypothetical protein